MSDVDRAKIRTSLALDARSRGQPPFACLDNPAPTTGHSSLRTLRMNWHR